MAIAAVPDYLLRQDLSQASPGLRFGLLLSIWTTRDDQRASLTKKSEAKSREGQDLAADIQQKGLERTVDAWLAAGRLPDIWQKNEDASRLAWRRAVALNSADLQRMAALAQRQAALAAPLAEQGRLLGVQARAVAPFTTGLGNEHPLENGFAFLNPYGLPYLPGSGVKGVLRQAARELESGDWGHRHGWTEDAITYLFGLQSDDGDKNHQRGALSCWDVFPQLAGDALQVEVMTPHQTHYYQKGDNPHESGQPNPINFLTVPPGSGFAFHIQCDLPLLRRHAPALAEGDAWQALLQAALAHAFQWLGFGAKTAVGYGAMEEDPAALKRREAAATAAQARRAAEAEASRLATLSPDDRAWDQAQVELAVFRTALERAKAAGAFNPGGPFNAERLTFIATARGWIEARSRRAAGELLTLSATKDWGRPSKKERWQELQQVIAELKGTN